MSPNGNSNKEQVKAGEVLIIQGETPKYMYYLHSGALELLRASAEFEGLALNIIVSKSKRVGFIRDEILITGISNAFADPSTKSVRVVEDSIISKYPVKQGGIDQIASENSAQVITILNHLFKRLEISISDASRYTGLYTYLCRINDNISLMCKVLPHANIPQKLQSKSENLYNLFISNDGDFLDQLSAKFLIKDNSSFLRKKYSFPGLPIDSLIEPKQCKLVKKFLKLDKKIFNAIIKEDHSIPETMIELISESLNRVLDRVYAIHNEIDKELDTLLGAENSWASYLVDGGGFEGWLNSDKLSKDFIKNFLLLIKKIHSFYLDVSGKNLLEVYSGPKKIHEFYITNKHQVTEENTQTESGSTGGLIRNSIHQIFEFALVEKEFQKSFIKAINDFKNMSNPFNTESDGRKVRRIISKNYWELFKQVYIRKQKESNVPPPIKLMMRFGFLDETLMEDEQIVSLMELAGLNEQIDGIPILYEEEFLNRVYKNEENPSITEMGLSYEAFIREQEKRKLGKKKLELNSNDEKVNKTMYEIEHRLAQTVAVCSGSTATAFPILTSFNMKGSPQKLYVSKSKLASIIKELMEIDYSVFYRETTLKLGDARELIQEEVAPNFILMPSFGSKTMLWQDLDGKNRKTKGRIVVPSFFIGDIKKSMAHTFACFRWELTRTIKGGLWADPVEGGITGAYFDYVNFYKKNSKLSGETKAKITERFKSLRTNRDRFADDYIMWMLFEKDGVMRLNNVVRDMFYRNIPFKKEMREKLKGMPAFAEIANRYKNIHSKSITSYERRFKKYIENEGVLPEKLQEFMIFLDS